MELEQMNQTERNKKSKEKNFVFNNADRKDIGPYTFLETFDSAYDRLINGNENRVKEYLYFSGNVVTGEELERMFGNE